MLFHCSRSVGLPQLTARYVATANAVSFWLSTSASILFVDKLGRRPLLIISAGVMAVAFLGVSIGVGVGLVTPPNNHSAGIAATVFIWLYFTAFSSGWISIPWLCTYADGCNYFARLLLVLYDRRSYIKKIYTLTFYLLLQTLLK